MYIKKKYYKKFRKFHRKKHEKKKQNKFLKIFLLLLLISNNYEFDYYYYYFNKKRKDNEPTLKIYVMAHKDFKNYRYHPIYTIVADDESELQKKYRLNIIYAKEGKLYNLKRAYGEMSRLYYIYQLYKNGNLSSKYVGLNHYRRYFNFTDNIPDLDEIFKNYDVILGDTDFQKRGMRGHYCTYHICKDYEEIIDIIKQMKPNYYETALRVGEKKYLHSCNLFIMKKEDFFKYCEFMYDILFEFDRRHNFNTDQDVLNYIVKVFKHPSYLQSRLQGYLAERIGNIFYFHNFKRIKTFSYGEFPYYEKPINKTLIEGNKNKIFKFSKGLLLKFFCKLNCILLLIFLFIFLFKKNNYFSEIKILN